MNLYKLIPAAAAVPTLLLASPALAKDSASADPGALSITPIFDGRVRHETVEQGALNANALTARLRAGAEAGLNRFSLLAEAEATVSPVDDYSAFPFVLAGDDLHRPQHAIIPDPRNIELNRLQLGYRLDRGSVTIGRQRINLDDQRWTGSVAWRQNEQTFDAVRAEAQLGGVGTDLTYAISQRTIFGSDAGPRTAYDGDFLFVGLSSGIGPLQAKLFSYLLDYDEPFFLANSSQTYGGILSGNLKPGGRNVALRFSYARQSDFANNPFEFAADYWSLEGGTTLAGFNVTTGWERLGSDDGRAVQTRWQPCTSLMAGPTCF